jgi:hypothetical protein
MGQPSAMLQPRKTPASPAPPPEADPEDEEEPDDPDDDPEDGEPELLVAPELEEPELLGDPELLVVPELLGDPELLVVPELLPPSSPDPVEPLPPHAAALAAATHRTMENGRLGNRIGASPPVCGTCDKCTVRCDGQNSAPLNAFLNAKVEDGMDLEMARVAPKRPPVTTVSAGVAPRPAGSPNTAKHLRRPRDHGEFGS